ncbi:MAG: DMT family transporter, partial [Woeseiaceae bacterium]
DLVMLGILWGASFLFMRIAVPEFGAFALAEVRVAIAAVVLLPIVLVRGKRQELTANWSTLAILGAHNTALPFLLFAYAALYLTAGTAAILNATAPIFAAIVAWLWLGEKLTMSRSLGLVIGIIGIYLLVGDKLGAPSSGAGLAAFAAIGASFLYGIGGNYARTRVAHVSSMTVAAGTQVASALLLLPVAIMAWPDQSPSLRAWAAVAFLGVLSTGLAYILYFRLIANVGPTNAITVTYLIPVFAMILGAVVIDEAITAPMLMGCAVILIGTALATGMLRLPFGKRV